MANAGMTGATERPIVAASFIVGADPGVRAERRGLTLSICQRLCQFIEPGAPYNHQTLHQALATAGGVTAKSPGGSKVKTGWMTKCFSKLGGCAENF